jgi:hypothetical protein
VMMWGTAANHAMYGNPPTKAPICNDVRMYHGVTCNDVGRKLHELCKNPGLHSYDERYFCNAWGAAVNHANLDASNKIKTTQQATQPTTLQVAPAQTSSGVGTKTVTIARTPPTIQTTWSTYM